MNNISNRKGLILLQVIIIVAVLAFLVVAILKFLLGRHATVSRSKKTVDAKSIIEACIAQKNIEWETLNSPVGGSCLIDTENTPGNINDDVRVVVEIRGTVPPYEVRYSVNYDNVKGY